MMAPLLDRLAASDRALLARWALGECSTLRARRTWILLTALGGAGVTIGGSVVPATLATGAWQSAGRMALGVLAVSHLLVQLVKRSVGRPRPTDATCVSLVRTPDRFSFPSGHAAAAMSLAIGYGVAFPAVAPLAGSLAVIVGFSRVALGVHYPGDVIAGQLLAVITGLMALVMG
jgi:undecaprenyl-diphosphatase